MSFLDQLHDLSAIMSKQIEIFFSPQNDNGQSEVLSPYQERVEDDGPVSEVLWQDS